MRASSKWIDQLEYALWKGIPLPKKPCNSPVKRKHQEEEDSKMDEAPPDFGSLLKAHLQGAAMKAERLMSLIQQRFPEIPEWEGGDEKKRCVHAIGNWLYRSVEKPHADQWPLLVAIAAVLPLKRDEADQLLQVAGMRSLGTLQQSASKAYQNLFAVWMEPVFAEEVREDFTEVKEGLGEQGSLIREIHARVLPATRDLVEDEKPIKQPSVEPHTYIPFPRDLLFQSRPGEFDYLENLLTGPQADHKPNGVGLVGITGMGGIGKTRLAVELAYRSQEQQRFPGGIFWMTAARADISAWQQRFAQLAVATDYLPSDDDASHSEKEARRARHLCQYLAEHTDALLILDNVEVPDFLPRIFPLLIGKEAQCPILYTSRLTIAPETIAIYPVDRLSEETALDLLLNETRSDLFRQIVSGQEQEEVEAARGICQRVGNLPLALVHLRNLLRLDQRISLKRLYEALSLQEIDTLRDVLFKTFGLSWQQVQSEEARRLFQLAALFQEATPLPLWLIGLAAGLDGSGEIFGLLGKALFHLQDVSLIEGLLGDQVRLHPLVREFGQHLLNEKSEHGLLLRREAEERLITVFTNIEKLEDFARKTSYWDCLERVRQVDDYLKLVKQGSGDGEFSLVHQLQFVYRWLDREAHLLGNEQWWSEKLPGLFYQQIFNQSVEDKERILVGTTDHPWIRQCESTGMTSLVLLKHFPVGDFPRVAYSPDGSKLLSTSWSKDASTICLWDAKTGQMLFRDQYLSHLRGIAFSPDSQMFFVCNGPAIQILEIASFSSSFIHLKGPQYTAEQFLDEKNYPEAIAISPDGNLLAIASDGIVLLWSLVEKRILFALDAPKEKKSIKKIVFSPQGDKLGAISKGISEYRGGGIYVWDIQTRKLLWFQSNMDAISLAFSPETNLMQIGTADKGIWSYDIHMGNGSQICPLSVIPYKCIAFSQDMRKVAASVHSGLGKVELWDLQTKRCFRSIFHNDLVADMAFSPDGKTLFTGGEDKATRLWNVQEDDAQQKTQEYWGRNVACTTFSPSKVVLSRENGTLEMYDIRSRNQLLHLDTSQEDMHLLRLSPDKTIIVTGSRRGRISLWNAQTGDLLFSLSIDQRAPQVVVFTPDSRNILFALPDGVIKLLDIKKKSLKVLLKCQKKVEDILFSHDEMFVFIYAFNYLQCCRVEKFFWSLHLIPFWQRSDWEPVVGYRGLEEVILSPDNKHILTIGNRATLWDTWGLPITPYLEVDVRAAAFLPSGNMLALGYQNGHVNFWDSETGEFLSSLEEYNHRLQRSRVNAVSFAPDGRTFVACTDDGYIFFWRLAARSSPRGKLMGIYLMKEYPKKVIRRSSIKIHWQNNTQLIIIDDDQLCLGIYRLEMMNMQTIL